MGGQNDVLGKIEACSFRTIFAPDINVLSPLNMGDIARNAYVPSIVEEEHRGRHDDSRKIEVITIRPWQSR